MDIMTKIGEIWSENAMGAVISRIKESDGSIMYHIFRKFLKI